MSQHRSQGFLASSRVLGAEQAARSSHGCHSGHSVQQTTSTVLGARAPAAAPKSSPCSRFGDVLQGPRGARHQLHKPSAQWGLVNSLQPLNVSELSKTVTTCPAFMKLQFPHWFRQASAPLVASFAGSLKKPSVMHGVSTRLGVSALLLTGLCWCGAASADPKSPPNCSPVHKATEIAYSRSELNKKKTAVSSWKN